MPELAQLSELVVRIASTGAIGVTVGLAMVVALRLLLPRADRSKLRAPVILLGSHALLILLRLAVDTARPFGRAVTVLALFLLLTSVGRCGFLLVVDIFLGRRMERPVPRIIREIAQGLMYAAILLVTLRAAGVEAAELLTTSALLTAVIGLALQDTLGNLFAGLAIQAQRPFEVGDGIQVEPDPRFIGRVIEINWRATKVVTLEQVEVTIPNGTLAKSSIKNFNKPTIVARRTIDVRVGFEAAPRAVEDALLSSVRGISGVLPEPAPFTLTMAFGESYIVYQLCYFIDDFNRRDRVDTSVRNRIWYSLQRAGIGLSVPVHAITTHDGAADARTRDDAQRSARRARALRGVDFLSALPQPLIERLASLSRTCHYTVGEVVIEQGTGGNELYIVESGEVAVLIGRKGGSTLEVARLGPGKFFGEMSLMTGEPRRATIQATQECELVKVDKDAFQEILVATPELVEQITEVLAARQHEIDESVAARRTAPHEGPEAKSGALLSKIKDFFAI